MATTPVSPLSTRRRRPATLHVTHELLKVPRAGHDLSGARAQGVHLFNRQPEARRKAFHCLTPIPVGQLVEIDLDEIDLEIIATLRALASLTPLLASPLYQLAGEPLESESEQCQRFEAVLVQGNGARGSYRLAQ